MTEGARGNELQALRSRLAALEALVGSLPSRFGSDLVKNTTRRIRTSTAHGFTSADHGAPLRLSGTSWVKSQADTAANAVIHGVLISVVNPRCFVMASAGYVTGVSAVTTSLTPGSIHYLSSTVAGALVTTAPAIQVPVIAADTTSSGYLKALGPGGGVTKPTQDGLVLCSNSAGTDAEWTNQVDIGRNATSQAGKLQLLSPNASGVAVEIDASLVTAAGKKLTLREIDVCVSGVAMKVLRLESAPY